MKKVSLFGGTGFVGSHYAKSYPKSTTVIDRDSIQSETNNILYMISTVHNYHPKDGNPLIDIETNLIHFMKVLDNARKKWGDRLVFTQVSTWFVYGQNPEIPAKENSHCNPKGFYSITARAREQLLISYCESFNLKYRILRLGNVIGAGDEKIGLKRNALQHFIKELALGRPIERYRQDSIRDFIDVRDCVRAINLIVEKGDLNQIYNVSNGQGLRVKELIDHAWITSGYKSKISEIEVSQFHKTVQTPAIYMDVSKIKKLGYVKQHDIKTSVEELVHYYEQRETK